MTHKAVKKIIINVKRNTPTMRSPNFSICEDLPTLKSAQMMGVILPIKKDATRSSAQSLTALKGSVALVKKIKVTNAVPPNNQARVGLIAEELLFATLKVY